MEEDMARLAWLARHLPRDVFDTAAAFTNGFFYAAAPARSSSLRYPGL